MVLTQAASGLLFGMPRSLQRSLPPQGFFRVIVMHLTMRFGPASLQGAIRNRLKRGPEGSAREDTEHDEKSIQSDLSYAEWPYLESHLPDPKPGGRPRVQSVREILDAVFYVTTWRAVAAPGAYFPTTTSRRGRPSTTLHQDMAHRRHVGASARVTSPQGACTTREDPSPSSQDTCNTFRKDMSSGRCTIAFGQYNLIADRNRRKRNVGDTSNRGDASGDALPIPSPKPAGESTKSGGSNTT
jgi:hypothetical protein